LHASEKENSFYGMDIDAIKRTDDCTVYKMKNPDGEGVMTSYQVFPGIELVYNDFHIPSCFQDVPPGGDILEINHCREGRFECAFENGAYVYMEKGDLAVNLRDNRTVASCFPLEHYHGIAIMVNLKEAAATLSSVLDDISIDLYKLCGKLCPDKRCFIMRAKPEIQHIFSELYTIPREVQKGYFKLKVLEILLFLSVTDISGYDENRKYFPKKQVEAVKQIKKYITQNMDQRFTLQELSEKFGIGLTSMKLCFKGVFGSSILSFLKSHRMQAAALMLRQSEDSVTTVAGKAGYTNASKFAAAFREETGMSPYEFRKNYLSEWSE
jgi:AraC-like DNA-binding protein